MMIRRRRARRSTKARTGILLLLALALVLPLAVQAASPPGSDDGGFGTPGPGAGVPTGGEEADEEAPSSPRDPVARFAAGEISEALREQLTWQAEQEGISLDKAIEKYAWQGPLAYLVNEIRQDYPNDFAGARIEQDLTAWIAFSGTAPAGAASSIRAFPRAVQIIENRGFTEAGLNQRLHSVHDSVMANDKVEDAVSTYDLATGRLEVTAAIEDSFDTPAQKKALSDLLRTELPIGSVANVGTSDVDLNVVSDIAGGAESDIRGGTHLSRCTAGFVLENSNGERNISTAGHCPNNLSLRNGNIRITLTFEDEHEGRWGDLQRHSVPSGHTLTNSIRYNSSGRRSRPILSTGVPVEGQVLLHYGKSTGYKSDWVYRGVVNAGIAEHLVAMFSHTTQGGDSGGPWFQGNTAYGIHFGSNIDIGRPASKRRSLFTPVHHIEDAFPGWDVATS